MSGGSGEHPLIDIINHDMEIYSLKADEIVRQLNRVMPYEELEKAFDWQNPPPMEQFEAQLQDLLAEKLWAGE